MRYPYGLPKRSPNLFSVTSRRFHPVLLLLALCLPLTMASSPPDPDGSANIPLTTGTSITDLPRGEISYPVPAPSNPDIIAYTVRDGNRNYLHLHHVATGADQRILHQARREQPVQGRTRSATRSEIESMLREAGLQTGYFEGDLAWSPGLDQFGYQWFAFAATQAGMVQLHLGYIASGETLRTVVFPISFANVVANPAFSPDGKSLVFSADGNLYLVGDIDRIIRKRDFKSMQPRRITSHANGSYFPAWSADNRLIAYQNRPDEGRRAGFESVFVIDAASITEGRLPTAHRVSIDDEVGKVRHHLRPSWAPTGRILAWYENAEQSETVETIRDGDGEVLEDTAPGKQIRLVRVEWDHSRSEYRGLEFQNAARRFFADPVRAFPRSAPQWASMEYDRRSAHGILWVRNDSDLEYPLNFSHLAYYSDNRQDFTFNIFSFSNRFAWLERTRNNRYPTAISSDGHTRYIYVTQADDRSELKVVDKQASDISSVIRREFREVPAVVRAGLYPGLGHFYIGENLRGTYMAGAFTVMAGVTAGSAIARYRNDQASPGNAILITLGAATGAVWAFNIWDLQRQFPVYYEVPVVSTFEGYRRDQDPEYLNGDHAVHIASKRNAIMLSMLYPGLGQIYIGERTKGYVLGFTFTALAGSTLASAAYRYHFIGQTPSNEVLFGLGTLTLGTWIYSLIDVQQSFTNTFFADTNAGGAGSTSLEPARRTELALAPRVGQLNIGNQIYREYAALGLSISF